MTDEQENARWEELAKQLGLDGTPQPTKTVATHVQPDDEAPMPAAYDEQPDIEITSDQSEAEPGEGERTKRRRGRRGRKKSADGEAKDRNAPGEGKNERGRGRRKGRREASAPAGVTDVRDSSVAEKAPIDDDEDTAKLSEWNIPTWNELIDSLYRPDR